MNDAQNDKLDPKGGSQDGSLDGPQGQTSDAPAPEPAPAKGPKPSRRAGITPRRMLLGLLFSVLRVSVTLILIGLVALGALLWRAKDSGVAAPAWLRDKVETALSDGLGETGVELGALVLILEEDLTPNVHLRDVILTPGGQGSRITLSDISGSFDLSALLDGALHPKEIRISGTQLTLHRDREGGYGIAIGESAQTSGPVFPRAPQSLTGANPDTARPDRDLEQIVEDLAVLFRRPTLQGLTRIEANALTVRYEDARSQRGWTVDGGRIELTRDGEDLNLRSDMTLLGARDYATGIEISVAGKLGSQAVSVALVVDDMPARDVATQSVGLAWLGVLDAPISGAFRVTTDEEGAFGPLNGTLQIGKGALAPDGTADPVPFEQALSYFTFDPDTQTLRFDELAVTSEWVVASAEGQIALSGNNFGRPEQMTGQLRITELTTNPAGVYPVPLYLEGAEAELRLQLDPFRLNLGRLDLRDRGETLRLAGWLNAEPEGWDLSLTGRIAELSADDLLELWPQAALPRTRDWVARNVLDGMMRDIQLGVRSTPTTKPDLVLNFEFDELITTFMKTLPPIEAASGHGEIRDDRFVVTADTGSVYAGDEAIDIAGTSFIYEDIRVKRGPAEVQLAAKSSVTGLLTILDYDPFNFLTKAGRGPDLAQGKAELTAKLNFNLVKNLQAEDVAVTYQGQLNDISSDQIAPGRVLRADRIDLRGDRDTLILAGDARLGDLPVGGEWRANLAPGGGSRVDGWVELSPRAVSELNLGLPKGSVSGQGRGDVTLIFDKGQPAQFDLTSDLGGVGLRLDALNWRKAQSSKGNLRVRGSLGTPVSVRALEIDAAGLAAKGAISLNPGGGLKQAQFSSVKVGRWLNAPVTLLGRGANRPPEIRVAGGAVDMRHVSLGGSGSTGSGGGTGNGPMTLNLDRLQVSDTIALTNFKADFQPGQGLRGRFSGLVNGRAAVSGHIVPQNGRSAVRVASNNAGGVLSAAGLLEKGRSGDLDLTLTPVGQEGNYDGLLRVTNIWLQDAPAMASLLSTLSVVGLLEQMAGGGISFGEVEADFRLTPDRVIVRRSSAVGASMGVSMDGIYTFANKAMDMQGVVSPFYLINGVGAIFSRKGEGLIGFNYRLKGPVANPKVQVNPLSLFTPGMFREIFRRPAPEVN